MTVFNHRVNQSLASGANGGALCRRRGGVLRIKAKGSFLDVPPVIAAFGYYVHLFNKILPHIRAEQAVLFAGIKGKPPWVAKPIGIDCRLCLSIIDKRIISRYLRYTGLCLHHT